MKTCEHQVCNVQGLRMIGHVYAGTNVYIDEVVEYRLMVGLRCAVVKGVIVLSNGSAYHQKYKGLIPLGRTRIVNENLQHYTICGQRKEWAND